MSVEIRPLSDALGAEALGVDFSGPVDEAIARQLEDALVAHIVLMIRDQRLEPEQYLRAMRSFGNLAQQIHVDELMEGVPEIWVIDSRRAPVADDGRRLLAGADIWHTDHTNLQKPPKITALLAVDLPPRGGDTCFANAHALYERLPAGTRARVDAMRTVNGPDGHVKLTGEARARFAVPAVHPLVRTHDVTGRRALYFNPSKVRHIEGMSSEESAAFLEALIEEAMHPDIVYRHQWRAGDLVLIDNRACLHQAMRDYDPAAGRVMHRVIIEGERPR